MVDFLPGNSIFFYFIDFFFSIYLVHTFQCFSNVQGVYLVEFLYNLSLSVYLVKKDTYNERVVKIVYFIYK